MIKLIQSVSFYKLFLQFLLRFLNSRLTFGGASSAGGAFLLRGHLVRSPCAKFSQNGDNKLGLIEYRDIGDLENDPRLHILLAGYNGARNTGSDIRTAEIVRQIQERIDNEKVQISVMTLGKENTCGFFGSGVRLVPFSPIFFVDVFKACCASQAVILCAGSTLKSKFANALTLYFCEAAGIMKNQHKPCIAYGSEAGEMDAFLERTVRRLCADTYFIARTRNSLDRIQRLGLKGHLGTDTAWRFNSSSHAQWAVTQLRQSGWDGVSPLLGMERLDADACNKLHEKLTTSASVFLSSDHDGCEMAALLRQLSMLITSRYHAEVLSMDAGVPGVAISMDERLDNIMQEMDLCRYQLLHADDTDLSSRLMSALEYMQSHREEIKDGIGHRLMIYQDRLDEMGDSGYFLFFYSCKYNPDYDILC